MTIEADDENLFDDEDGRRARIIRRARVEGIETAYESALQVCRDPLAPSQAKSAAQRTLLQIGGMLDRADRQPGGHEKPGAEMTPDELTAAVAEILREKKLGPTLKRPQATSETASVFD